MTRRTFIVFIATTLSLFAGNLFAEEASSTIKIACIGDSITFGSGIADRNQNSYPAQLARTLGEEWTVKNFGVSSATLLKKGNYPYWKLKQYKAALAFEPDVVIIKLGTNDSKPVNWKYKDEFVQNYVELIESFQNLDSDPTIWICMPVPAYPGRWGISDEVIQTEVIPLITEIAKQTNVKTIDLYTALSGHKEMFPDTVHPNNAGAKLISDTISELLLNQTP